VRLARIDANRLMDWLLAAGHASPESQRLEIELHVVGQGYELQAPNIEHLFIEPDRRIEET
jgi:hypothetical protein